MDIGPSSQSRETSRRRVLSPSAAKRSAEPFNSTLGLRYLGKVLLDDLHHHVPTSLVRRERFRAARERDSVEARLGDSQHDAVRNFLQSKDDESRRLGGIVDAALNGEGMPPERK